MPHDASNLLTTTCTPSAARMPSFAQRHTAALLCSPAPSYTLAPPPRPGAAAPMPPCPSSLTAAWAMIRPLCSLMLGAKGIRLVLDSDPSHDGLYDETARVSAAQRDGLSVPVNTRPNYSSTPTEPPRFSFAVTTISDFCQYAQGIPMEEYAGWCQALHARAAWILCPRIRLLLHMPMQMGHTTKITTSPFRGVRLISWALVVRAWIWLEEGKESEQWGLLYTFPQSVGIAVGRPSSSYYFVGVQDDGLFCLDPHHSRPTVPLRPFAAEPAPSIPRPPSSSSHGHHSHTLTHSHERRSLSPKLHTRAADPQAPNPATGIMSPVVKRSTSLGKQRVTPGSEGFSGREEVEGEAGEQGHDRACGLCAMQRVVFPPVPVGRQRNQLGSPRPRPSLRLRRDHSPSSSSTSTFAIASSSSSIAHLSTSHLTVFKNHTVGQAQTPRRPRHTTVSPEVPAACWGPLISAAGGVRAIKRERGSGGWHGVMLDRKRYASGAYTAAGTSANEYAASNSKPYELIERAGGWDGVPEGAAYGVKGSDTEEDGEVDVVGGGIAADDLNPNRDSFSKCTVLIA
ncbi:hypothetical protein B0H13DRAFT_2353643 [Mycena leptocephala]|nr:hypothetical protein B0H13DRAFT_2353643 [Mycena leptocephala]